MIVSVKENQLRTCSGVRIKTKKYIEKKKRNNQNLKSVFHCTTR